MAKLFSFSFGIKSDPQKRICSKIRDWLDFLRQLSTGSP